MKTVKKMYGTYMYERYLFAKEKDRFTRKLKRVNKQLEISGASDIKSVSYVNDGSCYLGSCASFLLCCVTAEILLAVETGEWQQLMRKSKYQIYSTLYNTLKRTRRVAKLLLL